ncbi:MAG: NGG1p interacting factor NIF3 [Thermodesulfobacteriota bacterium]
MKIQDIYEKAYTRGMEVDPRGIEEVRAELKKIKKDFEDLKEKNKETFDGERLVNPYSDTRVLYPGTAHKEIKRVLVGIDMEVGEILLADRLGEKGRPIDLIIAHHPEGRAMANLHAVMNMQAGIMLKYGVPINVAEDIMAERISEVRRRIMPANHMRAVDAARLLEMPFMCMHTPADNSVVSFLQGLFDEKKPAYVSDIIELLAEIPEYENAAKEVMSPDVVCGTGKRKAGKIFVDMTGGTGGSKKAFTKLSNAGVGTVVGMHISEDHRKEAEKNHLNVIIAGHMASDNLGMNLLFDNILSPDIEIVETAGFRRVSRA